MNKLIKRYQNGGKTFNIDSTSSGNFNGYIQANKQQKDRAIQQMNIIHSSERKFQDEGNILNYVHNRFPITKSLQINTYNDPNFQPGGGDLEYMQQKHDTLPYYNNYQKPNNLKGKSVIVYNNNMGNNTNEAIALDALSHGLREQDKDWKEYFLPELEKVWKNNDYVLGDMDKGDNPEESYHNAVDGAIRNLLANDSIRKPGRYSPTSELHFMTDKPEERKAWDNAYNYLTSNKIVFPGNKEIIVTGHMPKKQQGGNVPYYLGRRTPHHTVWQIATQIGRMKNKPNIVNRIEGGAQYGLKNYITNYNDPSQITSFKMSYGERDGKNYAFPLVQQINGKLVDFEDPKNGGEQAGMKSAFKRKDIIPMSSEADADYFTNNNYKIAYPNVIRPDYFNAKKYQGGGTLSKNILNQAKYLMNMPKALGTSGALSFYGEDTRFTPHVTLQDDLNKNNYDGDLKNYSYSLPKDIVITGTSPMYLETQEPFTDGYPIGHSSVSVDTYNNNGGGNYYEESKSMSDNGYNLLTNNCSDGTRQVLEYTFNKKINPFLFTTPGDVRDFAIDSLHATPNKENPHILYIPINKDQKDRAIQRIQQLNTQEGGPQ